MWDVVDAFGDMMCLGDVLTLEGGSIVFGERSSVRVMLAGSMCLLSRRWIMDFVIAYRSD